MAAWLFWPEHQSKVSSHWWLDPHPARHRSNSDRIKLARGHLNFLRRDLNSAAISKTKVRLFGRTFAFVQHCNLGLFTMVFPNGTKGWDNHSIRHILGDEGTEWDFTAACAE
jgi:hypothetical protein